MDVRMQRRARHLLEFRPAELERVFDLTPDLEVPGLEIYAWHRAVVQHGPFLSEVLTRRDALLLLFADLRSPAEKAAHPGSLCTMQPQASSSNLSSRRVMNLAASALLPPSFWPLSCSSARRRSARVWSISGVRSRTPSAMVDSRIAMAIRALSTACPFCASASRNSARTASECGPVEGMSRSALARDAFVGRERVLHRVSRVCFWLERPKPRLEPFRSEHAHLNFVEVTAVADDRVAQAALDP